MHITSEKFTVRKRFALTISRGTTSQTTNLWVRLEEDGIEGWGEASPFAVVEGEREDIDELLSQFKYIVPKLEQYSAWDRQSIEEILLKEKIFSSLRAAIDMALHDWLGKVAGLPLWRMWGLDRSRIVPISVTIGISSPENAKL
ncbi:MAG: dipeptide epimerase, partial [Xenococcaceae cyanobacterium]